MGQERWLRGKEHILLFRIELDLDFQYSQRAAHSSLELQFQRTQHPLPASVRTHVHVHTHIKVMFKGKYRGTRLNPLPLGNRGRWIFELRASLVYIVSSRTAKATWKDPVFGVAVPRLCSGNPEQSSLSQDAGVRLGLSLHSCLYPSGLGLEV